MHKQLVSRLYPRPEERGFTLGTDKKHILKQIEEMNVTVITNLELKALRQIAQAADGNGDLYKALSE